MHLLFEIVVILAFAAFIIFVCNRLRIPAVVGFLFTGMTIGPFGLGIVQDIKHVEELAEIGVILLLFTIGLEFSFKNLLSIKRQAFIGGGLQLVLTTLVVIPFGMIWDFSLGSSIFLGFLVTLSSTAIVLKIIQKRAEIETPHGRNALAILIFQDIAVVPMMLFVPFIAGAAPDMGKTFAVLLLKGVVVIVLVYIGVVFIIPKLLHLIASTRDRELFLISIVVICFSIAWLTAKAGLSLALGAFLAGLIISESEYSHEAVANILPFRDVFTSFFFISIGMLLNLKFAVDHIGIVLLSASGVIVLKSLIIFAIVMLMGFPFRTGVLTGLSLAQVGEFSFVLFKSSMDYQLLPDDFYQLFLSLSVLTMILAPFVIAAASRIADGLLKLPLPVKIREGLYYVKTREGAGGHGCFENHLIIIGFGMNGRHLARAAKLWNIPYVIIETNPETVRKEKQKGEPIFFGDASHEAILEHACIGGAKIVAIAISDSISVRRIIKTARVLKPDVHIIVRTRFFNEYKLLMQLGANEVIPEEYETSIEILSRVLSKYFVPRDEVEHFVRQVRAEGYDIFRHLPDDFAQIREFELPNVEIRRFRVGSEAPAAGKSLEEIGLRKNYGVTLLAVRKENEVVSSPGANTRLASGNIVLLVGQTENLLRAARLFLNPENGSEVER